MKKKPKKEVREILEIVWLDSLHTNGWKYLDDYKDKFDDVECLTHKTVGYILKDGLHTIVVCQSLKEKEFEDGDQSIDAIMEIPKCSIIKTRKLT